MQNPSKTHNISLLKPSNKWQLQLTTRNIDPRIQHCRRLHGAAQSLMLQQLLKQPTLLVLLAQNSTQATQIHSELLYFATPEQTADIHLFPDWETLPYDPISPHPDLTAARINLLYNLPQLQHGIIITSVASSMQYLPPRHYFSAITQPLQAGQAYPAQRLRAELDAAGYQLVEQVTEHAQYSVRGAIIDFFASGDALPLRVELFDDEIASLRYFDPETQRSQQKVTQSKPLLHAREYSLDDASIDQFRKSWRALFTDDAHRSALYQNISDGRSQAGIEYYLPLFFTETATLFDYLPQHSMVVQLAPDDHSIDPPPPTTNTPPTTATQTQSAAQLQWEMLQQRYAQLSGDRLRPICPPELLYMKPEQWRQQQQSWPQIELHATDNAAPQSTQQPTATAQDANKNTGGGTDLNDNSLYFATQAPPTLQLNLRDKKPLLPFEKWLLQHPSYQVLIVCASPGREANLHDLLNATGYKIQQVADWETFLNSAETAQPCIQVGANQVDTTVEKNTPHNNTTTGYKPIIYTTCGELQRGLCLTDPAIAILTENELFANFVPQTRRRKVTSANLNQVMDRLQQMAIGTPVVHQKYGVGRYQGLEIVQHHDVPEQPMGEFMVISYAEDSKVYVPIQSLEQISRYVGADAEHAPLHHLGRKQWAQAKQKSASKIRDIAAELLALYRKRHHATGFCFKQPDANYRAFCASFPFEETADQASAIDAVINDMCQARCMDRLVCGDVGFGKTEVAMRAAFLAVMSGKQVALLVPTTLLAQQHMQNFQDRFIAWPIKIGCLSRLQTAKQQQSMLEQLAAGQLDIVIATHKLLSDRTKFNNLGLLIIDEEHRFGVKQKDRMKQLRASIDILTLTATPIPRTLNLALSGTRDLSIIATPPESRNAIKTFVRELTPGIIKEALQREIQRGGQAYYVHNKVGSIADTCAKIQALVPEAKVRFAHGQMREGELESIMRDFYQQQFNVLVATTIIESGIDIPSANTMIIERADRFGLAELHQIRGRVGRSHHQAYAYLLTPHPKALTRDAAKRLEAIEQLQDLGAGFLLASQDLEIRGAGELLGSNQSGQIHSIGFTLYMDMLNATVKNMQQGKDTAATDPLPMHAVIDLPFACLLPDDYIHDVELRLDIYKRLASCSTTAALAELKIELIDRFGSLPTAALNLWLTHQLRLTATPLGISQIHASGQFVYYSIQAHNQINQQQLIQLLQQCSDQFQLQGATKLRQRLAAPDNHDAAACAGYISEITSTLQKLTTDC